MSFKSARLLGHYQHLDAAVTLLEDCSNVYLQLPYYIFLPSVLWCCWLGGRKGIRPVKSEWWGAGLVICLERDADLHMAHLMPLPLTVSCFSKIQIGFTFLVPAHPGSPGQRAVKRVCVCVCVKQQHKISSSDNKTRLCSKWWYYSTWTDTIWNEPACWQLVGCLRLFHKTNIETQQQKHR